MRDTMRPVSPDGDTTLSPARLRTSYQPSCAARTHSAARDTTGFETGAGRSSAASCCVAASTPPPPLPPVQTGRAPPSAPRTNRTRLRSPWMCRAREHRAPTPRHAHLLACGCHPRDGDRDVAEHVLLVRACSDGPASGPPHGHRSIVRRSAAGRAAPRSWPMSETVTSSSSAPSCAV